MTRRRPSRNRIRCRGCSWPWRRCTRRSWICAAWPPGGENQIGRKFKSINRLMAGTILIRLQKCNYLWTDHGLAQMLPNALARLCRQLISGFRFDLKITRLYAKFIAPEQIGRHFNALRRQKFRNVHFKNEFLYLSPAPATGPGSFIDCNRKCGENEILFN